MESQDAPIPIPRTDSFGVAAYWQSLALDRLSCAAAGLIALVVYVLTLAPGLTGEDSGELIAGAWALGIPHPPGYPLWCLLAYPILHFVDIGSVAWRGNLASAIFGAAGIYFVAETVLALFGRRWAAVAAALALAFSREYWQQSVAAEVYTLSAALVAVHLLLLARWSQSRRSASLYGAAFVAGLASAHYTLNLVLVPLCVVYVVLLDLRPRRWRQYCWLLVMTLPGWLIYLYLPIRSLANPAMDWGDPESWSSFMEVVTRAQYRDLLMGPVSFGPELLRHVGNSGRQLVFEFTPWVGVLALAGLLLWTLNEVMGNVSRIHSPPFAVYAGVAALAFAAGAQFTPNYPVEYHWEWIRTPYWLPVIVISTLFLGYITALSGDKNIVLYAILCIFSICSPLVFNYTDSNRRSDRVVEGYARTLLDGMDANAIYFGGGDHTIFPVVYLQVVEGRRPDVLLANRYGYPAPELFVLAGEAAPRSRPSEEDEQRLFAAVLVKTSRPLYSAVPRLISNANRVNEGLLYRYLRESESGRTLAPIDSPVSAQDTRGDWSNELVAHEYLAARARALFDEGRSAEALEALDRAARFVHGDKGALNNLGLNAAEGGQVAAASVYFQGALLSDPLFLPAALNLARCYLLEGTPREAFAVLSRFEEAGLRDPRIAEMKRAALDAQQGR